jgi:hypothetical protein
LVDSREELGGLAGRTWWTRGKNLVDSREDSVS